MKLIRIILISVCCAFALSASAQLSIGTVDSGPYTNGSTIAATFTIDPASCILQGNVFQLWLSNDDFATERQIGTYNSFYSTFVNGLIPNTALAPPGTNWKVRIKSTTPAYISPASAAFEIKAGPAVVARVISNRILGTTQDAFGFCSNQTGTAADVVLNSSSSTPNGTVTATITNELTPGTTAIALAPQYIFNAGNAHYTMYVKEVMPDGTVGTKAYFIINNETITAFSTTGNNVVCLPGGALTYLITATGPSGIQKNFPGNTYRIDWGDNTVNTYTYCDLKGGTVQHTYINTSCGQTYISGSTTIYNAFGINIQMLSPYCGEVGTAVSTTAKVVNITQNHFDGPLVGCTNADLTFTNESVLGDDPNNTGPSCLPDNATFNWYIDGNLVLAGATRADALTYRFTTNGNHTIRLESISSTQCQAPDFFRTICIQNPPVPNFNFTPSNTCGPAVIKVHNTSVVDQVCNTNNVYTWSVSPAVTFANGTNANTFEPEFNFNDPGVYTITLAISTATCGIVTSVREVIINSFPVAILSPSTTLCNIGTYDFNPFTSGPTKTIVSGTAADLPDSYTWTITPNTFSFAPGLDLHSKYPSITFNDFVEYTITLVHKNACGTETATQKIAFTPAPIVNAGPDQSICYNEPLVNLSGSINGSSTGQQWVGGNGTFSPDRGTLNATYAPTVAERDAGQVTLTLRVTTTLPAPCNTIDNDVIITIKPKVVISSPNTKTICTGTAVNYPPASSNVGVTYTWTATGSANASGYTNGSGQMISDVLTNSDATTNATVTYILTPTSDGCTGDPFTLTVTVAPNPILTPTAANPVICSQQNAGITLTSNLGPTTQYTWTSIATGVLTGNTNNNTPIVTTSINDQLVNNGTTTESVTYTITPISANGCPGTPETITITVEPQPTTPFAGPNESICNVPTYTLKGNQPVVGTGKWTQVITFPGITFDDDTKPDAIVSNLLAGNTYIFRWTITGTPSCSPKTADVSIIVDPISAGGTTAGSQAVCAGTNAGQIILNGQIGNVIRWESSLDGLTWPTLINETGTTLSFANLTATTYFRAVVQSGSCAAAFSTAAVVTVNQPVTTANAGAPQVLCNVNSTTLNGNTPAPNTGMWTVFPSPIPGVTFDDPTLPNATVSGLVAGQTYIFRWTISGMAPCPPSTSDVTVKVDLPSNGGTTAGSASVCAGSNNGNITVSGHVGNILRWESSTDGFVTLTTIAATGTSIPYLNLTTTTQYRAVVQNGSCGPAFSTVATITVNQGAIGADAGIDQILCDLSSTTLAGNSPLTNTGLWTIISGPAGAVITDPTLFNTTVTGLVGSGSYVFRWTISGLTPCPSTSDDVNIVNLPNIQNNTISTPTTTNCEGQTITLTGGVPTGGSGTYTYSWESSPTGAAPWMVINGQTNRDLNVTVTSTISYRRAVSSGACSTFSNILTIVALPSIANNSIASDQIICLTTTPNAIVGSQPTGGDGTNYTYGWEQSTDGVVWSFVPGAIGKDYAPPAITQTTYYRRLVSSAACTGAQQNISSQVKITVNQNARAEFTYTSDIGCVPYVLDANNIKAVPYTDRNNTYTWFADGVQIGTGINFPGFTINTYNANVVIKLVVTSSLGCAPDEFSHAFTTRENIVAAFTQSVTEGCGPLSVTFTNTTPVAAGNSYEWSIDGIVVSTATDLVQITLASDPSGKDKIYEINLKVTSVCGINNVIHQVTVKADPVPAISPQSTTGCAPFLARFVNTSPGGTANTYLIDFGDGSPVEPHAYGDVLTHTYTTTVVRDFEVRMTAANSCGTITSTPVIIRVSPNNIIPLFFAQGNQLTVCEGTTVDFRNNTLGASSFTYDFGDGSTPVTSPSSLPETVSHRYDRAGTFTATMVATNACSTNSASQQITVLASPTATFTSDFIIGCSGLVVKFAQTSSGAISYLWDFGDGSTSTDPAPTHTYANATPGQYNVTLTVMNSLGCPFTETKNNYITIVGPPKAAFAVSPAAVISIPDYTFKFTNESTIDPQTYRWTFGDGDFSAQKDPTHTYTDTGRFLVTLRTYNEQGCVDSIQKYVQIVGIPGYTFVPNSFIPGGTSVPLQKFTAVGSGMKTWKMTIFNKWGQVLWETTKLDEGKPVEGWDGTFKSVPQPQGIYFWKIEVEMINGTEWKGMSLGNAPPRRTGQIYLIR